MTLFNTQQTAAGALNLDSQVDFTSVQNSETRQYINLPDGYYDAEILTIEEGMHADNGNSKIGTCPQMTVHMVIHSEKGDVQIEKILYLHELCLKSINVYFTSCGIETMGKSLRACFDESLGKVARIELKTRNYMKDGEMKIFHNSVERFCYRQKNNTTQTNNTQQSGQNGGLDINRNELPF